MFYSLTGKIIYKDEQTVAISCGGVGFKCFTTRNSLAKLSLQSGDVTVFTHLNVREDALDLFGFATNDELDAFKLLITVSGVGPKAALAILSELTPDAFAVAVASGDSKAITAANGVGPKLAQYIFSSFLLLSPDLYTLRVYVDEAMFQFRYHRKYIRER